MPLLQEYSRTRSSALRDEIVLACMDLVESIAHRYRFTGEPVDDIAQEGYIGLINAVEMFDVTRGVKFTTYASHAVQGSIQHYLRDRGKLIREPGWLHDLNQKINKAMARLHQRLGREPTVTEIAQDLNLPDQQVAEAVRTRDVFRVSSLEQPSPDDPDSTFAPVERERARPAGGDGDDFPIVERLALEEAIEKLRSAERQVVYDFFFNDLSKTEIAGKLGYSISHVSHLLRRALKAMKDAMLTEERAVMRRQLRSIESQLEHYVRRVEEETIKDEVTGLYTRHYIMERLDEESARCRRYGQQLCLCLMEVNGLAGYRDALGDPEGDRVMCQVADMLTNGARRIDRIGRYDADRFVLLLPHTGEQAVVLCRRLSARFADMSAHWRLPAGVGLAACFGIAVFPRSGDTPEALMRSAGAALEQAVTDEASEGVVIDDPVAPLG